MTEYCAVQSKLATVPRRYVSDYFSESQSPSTQSQRLDVNKLIRSNFLDWHHNLRIVLKYEKMDYVLEQPFPRVPTKNSIEENVAAYNEHSDDNNTVACMILVAILSELQKQHECINAFTVIFHHKKLHDEQSHMESYETTRNYIDVKWQKDF
ncbi:uncharacterized protein LOC111384555 [Olea europaea var. sylvestris]|uniref:uncharacterized protein LOC111384555 n=1 Tax=Olea europaea var. sylvestris TaxID=158386 RepID=UPI000C1D364F|nr:uncharacterized protein LOC111384555 [Olea europaea var. sylvestris]